MINHWEEFCFREDASSVLLQFRRGVNATPDGTTGIDLRLHLVSPTDTAIVTHPVGWMLVNCGALWEGEERRGEGKVLKAAPSAQTTDLNAVLKCT